MSTNVNYRKLAFETYLPICVYCGFGIQGVLEVAHLDQKRRNNAIENLALLCPTCHKMPDIKLIPTEVIVHMRDTERKAIWTDRMKDAGKKAAATRKKNAQAAAAKRTTAAKKAWATRKTTASLAAGE